MKSGTNESPLDKISALLSKEKGPERPTQGCAEKRKLLNTLLMNTEEDPFLALAPDKWIRRIIGSKHI